MAEKEKANPLAALEWRCIGPFRGGRVVAVAGDPSDPAVFYFGAVAGGIWKTYDAGTFWECVSDGFLKTSSVGGLAVAEADPNVVYAGMGETTIRIDVSHGDGVYKSSDAGKTWAHMGLKDTRHIGKVRVHPHNPDWVYVAALGHAFGPNQQRGVFRSKNGGKTWEHVLFRSEKAGAVDLSIDIQNPRVMYTGIWETYRSFWNISSGGPDSSIYRTTDGGDTWEDISRKPGLPEAVLGKIAVAASPARTGRVWALIEAGNDEAGLYRSDDYGDTWERVSEDGNLLSRAWYFTHMTPDTMDPETVYIMNLAFWKSVDGGRSFNEITTPHGDNHDLWIDPKNPQRMIEGNDGGACVTFNGGLSWTTVLNQPTAQFYHVTVDNQYPYRVYGTQQDNSSISVPSRSDRGAITWEDCYPAGTGESGYIAVHPEDADIVYVGAVGSSPGGGGALQRYDHRARQIRLVTVWPEIMSGWGASDYRYRFPWTFPIVFSPHDPKVLYTAGNMIFRTTDDGTTWEPISPDLTRADPETLKPSGGPINKDAIGAETYAVIYAFVESPHEKGVYWAGSDDGLVHISRDGGKEWTNVTPKDLPEWTMISIIEVSPHDPATAYIAATRYKLDDYAPYLYKTNDYGQTWVKITNGIPADDFTRVIREDPGRRGLLYAGTETGLYISFNDGVSWERFQLNLPVAPIHDMLIKDNDLVVATHGRSFWILDDLTPLHSYNDKLTGAAAHLFKPRAAVRIMPKIFEEWLGGSPGKNYMTTLGVIAPFVEVKTPENAVRRKFLDAGENPHNGPVITYYLKEKPQEKISLTFLDADGQVIRQFFSKDEAEEKAIAKEKKEKGDPTPPELRISANAGLNRFAWDMRYPESPAVERKDMAGARLRGPIVAPGKYQAQLKVGDKVLTETFEIVKDPRVDVSQEDLQAQFDLWMRVHAKVTETVQAVNRIYNLQQQLDEWSKRVAGYEKAEAIASEAAAIKDKLKPIVDALITPEAKTAWASNNFGVRLLNKLLSLPAVVASADWKPTQAAMDVFEHLSGQIDEQITALNAVIETDIAGFNKLVHESQVAAIIPRSG